MITAINDGPWPMQSPKNCLIIIVPRSENLIVLSLQEIKNESVYQPTKNAECALSFSISCED